MEGSSPKINKSENNHTVRFPESSSEKSEENLEKKNSKTKYDWIFKQKS